METQQEAEKPKPKSGPHPGRLVELPSGRNVRVQIWHIGTTMDDGHHFTFIKLVDELSMAGVSGLADCSPSDNFCKRTGRKLAMKRAIAKWDRILAMPKLSKADRRALWAVVLPSFHKQQD